MAKNVYTAIVGRPTTKYMPVNVMVNNDKIRRSVEQFINNPPKGAIRLDGSSGTWFTKTGQMVNCREGTDLYMKNVPGGITIENSVWRG